jgi:hypothetical protein
VLDMLTPVEEPGYHPRADPRADLRTLEQMWLDKLSPYAERGYHTARPEPGTTGPAPRGGEC